MKNKKKIILIVFAALMAVGIIYFILRPAPNAFDPKEDIISYYTNSFVGNNYIIVGLLPPEQQKKLLEKKGVSDFPFLFSFDISGTQSPWLTGRYDEETIKETKKFGNQLLSGDGLSQIQGNILLAAVAFKERRYEKYLGYGKAAFKEAEKQSKQGSLHDYHYHIMAATIVAHAAMLQGNDNEAFEWATKAVAYPPSLAQLPASLMRAQYAVVSKNYSQAKTFYKTLLEQDFSELGYFRIPILISYGSLCLIERNLDCTAAKVKELKNLNAGHLDVLLFSASIAAINKDYAKAVVELEEVLKINPNLSLAYYLGGLVEEALGNYEKAEEFYQKALVLAPNDISLFPRNAKALNQGAENGIKRLSPIKIND